MMPSKEKEKEGDRRMCLCSSETGREKEESVRSIDSLEEKGKERGREGERADDDVGRRARGEEETDARRDGWGIYRFEVTRMKGREEEKECLELPLQNLVDGCVDPGDPGGEVGFGETGKEMGSSRSVRDRERGRVSPRALRSIQVSGKGRRHALLGDAHQRSTREVALELRQQLIVRRVRAFARRRRSGKRIRRRRQRERRHPRVLRSHPTAHHRRRHEAPCSVTRGRSSAGERTHAHHGVSRRAHAWELRRVELAVEVGRVGRASVATAHRWRRRRGAGLVGRDVAVGGVRSVAKGGHRGHTRGLRVVGLGSEGRIRAMVFERGGVSAARDKKA
jgi:hypothetical protein